jgi:hypothetical protein
MWQPILLAIGLGCAGCGVAHKPESAKFVAAYEVSLPTKEERAEFLALVSQEAKAEELHLYASSAEELEQTAQAIPVARKTVDAAVWRRAEDDQLEATIMDGHDHLGLVWLMFSHGENPSLASRFRARVMDKILSRWPRTLSLPITPSGGIPLHKDLRQTVDGYRVKRSAAASYEFPPSSPLIARD